MNQLVTQRMTPAEDKAAPGHPASRLILIRLSQSRGEATLPTSAAAAGRGRKLPAEPLQEPSLGWCRRALPRISLATTLAVAAPGSTAGGSPQPPCSL